MHLTTPSTFFGQLRETLLGPTLQQSEVDGCNAILTACAGWPVAWMAYGLATAYHETAHTMQPVKEIGGPDYFRRMYDPEGLRPAVAARLGNIHPGDGALFAGRGYPQLTGRANYERADRELGLNGELIANPERALEPAIAAGIMERGMREGWFTGRKLADYLPTQGEGAEDQFTAARHIINGTDRAALIAGYAMRFQDALTVGGWSSEAA